MSATTCQLPTCNAVIQATRKGMKYCNSSCREKAQWAARKRAPCTICGGPTGVNLSVAPLATHNACLREHWEHGTEKGYKTNACRCTSCSQWNREAAASYIKRIRAGTIERPACIEADCARPSATRSMCTMHYKRWATQNGMNRPPSSKWTDNARSNYHARRARTNGSRHSDRILVAELLAAGNLICRWCGDQIDATLTYPHKYSKSLDHTIPISRGGSHTLDNVTLMHLICNLSKGAR